MNLPCLTDARKRTNSNVEHIILNHDYQNNELFKEKKYFIKTYGCQMNVHDSEEISCYLESLGFIKTDVLEESDIVVLNTCAVRENAHDKLYGFLGRCKHIKTSINKNLIICICGCMAQEESVCSNLIKNYKFVDIVFGTHNINELPSMIINKMNKQNINVYSIEGNVYENIRYKRDSNFKAWVNIQYGCDKFCTYCIVPYTRGKQRSRKSKYILDEVYKLKEQGYKEITLLGQNVNAYGKDLDDEINFATLLENVAKSGIERVRFITSHPWDFTDEMINVIKEYKNIMPYIHLPLQSGSDRILKLMGRRYTKDEYINLFNKIKNSIDNVAITTDIIVGFPNETEEDFLETLDVVNKCKYDSAFTFIYSKREGTPAALIDDSIKLDEKEERLHRLNELINNYSLMNNKKYIGEVLKVLVEDVNPKDESVVCGYSEQMKLVNFTGDKSLIGKIVDVEITDAKSFSLNGKLI